MSDLEPLRSDTQQQVWYHCSIQIQKRPAGGFHRWLHWSLALGLSQGSKQSRALSPTGEQAVSGNRVYSRVEEWVVKDTGANVRWKNTTESWRTGGGGGVQWTAPECMERNIQQGELWSCTQRQLELSGARTVRRVVHFQPKRSHKREKPDNPSKRLLCRQNTNRDTRWTLHIQRYGRLIRDVRGHDQHKPNQRCWAL